MQGIIPRAVGHIFSHIEKAEAGEEFTIRVSFLEIYREQVKVRALGGVGLRCC